MMKLLSALKWKFFPYRMRVERRCQEEEGYCIELGSEGPNLYVRYRCRERTLYAEVRPEGWWNRDWRLFINSYSVWPESIEDRPTKQELDLVTRRMIQFLEVWGGNVLLDATEYIGTDALKKELAIKGIEYFDFDGALIFDINNENEEDEIRT